MTSTKENRHFLTYVFCYVGPWRFFFPQPLVDGFSKLWLRGKGNLRVETLIPAGSMLGFMLGPCSRKKNVQKQQYLQGFWHAGFKNSNIYNDFLSFLNENVQKLQYLKGFWR